MNPLPRSFFQRDDVIRVGKDLIGKTLFTSIDGLVSGGLIVETESYNGTADRACHAFNGKRTKRTEVMYEEGGVAYVYLCYGLHLLFNIVTGKKEDPKAVLIRAIYPTHGLSIIKNRKGLKPNDPMPFEATEGPSKVTKALGIGREHNGADVFSQKLWVEEGKNIDPSDIIASPRVGVAYAKEDALLPYRFQLKKSHFL